MQHLESCPGLHLPRRSEVGLLQAQCCSRSQQRGPGRADPLAQQMELRLGEKVTPTPLALPENQSKRRQPRRTSHTYTCCTQHTKTTNSATSHIRPRAQNHTQPGKTIKSVRELKAKTPTDNPTTPLQQRQFLYFLTHHACQKLKQDGPQTPPITRSRLLTDASHL